MNKFKLTLIPVLMVIPMTASALWWNPFTWKIFQKQEPVVQVQPTTEKTPEEKISDLQKQLDDLKKQQTTSTSVVLPSATTQVVKKDVKKSVSNPAIVTDICPEIEGVQTVVPVGYIKNGNGQCILANTQIQTPSPQPQQIQTTSSTEKNYYSETRSRLIELIGIEKSYGEWLQNTSNQFRSTSLTLAGYNTGGLYAQARDNAIQLANTHAQVLDSLRATNIKNVTALETILAEVNKNTNAFVDMATYNRLDNPQSVINDINEVKRSTQEDLNLVQSALKYH